MESDAGVLGNKKNKKKVGFVLLIVVIVAIIAGYYAWKHHDNNKKYVFKAATPQQVENNSKATNNKLLDKKDYTTYQYLQAALASQYIANNQLSDAERVLQNVLNTVPKNSLVSPTYGAMVELQKAKKNTTQYKVYMASYIDLLKKEGNNDAAAQQQKVLDSGL